MTATLHYFANRGRGEIIRLTLVAANIPFIEEILTEKERYLQLIKDDKLLFNQVPLLEIDGRRLVQSDAIVRYVGRKAGLVGRTEEEMVLIDEMYEAGRDFINPARPLGFEDEEPILAHVKAKILPKYLPLYEKILASNGSGYLVGPSVSIADLGLLEPLLVYVEYLGKDVLDGYPAVQKFFSTLTSLDSISAFLSGPQRKPKNSKQLREVVHRVLY